MSEREREEREREREREREKKREGEREREQRERASERDKQKDIQTSKRSKEPCKLKSATSPSPNLFFGKAWHDGEIESKDGSFFIREPIAACRHSFGMVRGPLAKDEVSGFAKRLTLRFMGQSYT